LRIHRIEIEGLELLDVGIIPERLDVVVLAGLGLENVDQHVEIVEQNPFFVLQAFHVEGFGVGHALGLLLHIVAQSFHVRLGISRTNYEIIKIYVIDFFQVYALDIHPLFFYK
jgi:hypothetical protein